MIGPGRSRVLAAALLGVLLVTGCSTLPVTGEVHTRPDTAAEGDGPPPYFVPPGPVAGAFPEEVVRGFLLAAQANPPSTSVARSFLASQTRATWKPVQGTVVYDAATLEAMPGGVRARFTSAHRLDGRGGWAGGPADSSISMSFSMVEEDGEWRISSLPQELPVPTSYFRSLYVPYLLYFFDRTGTVLVPTRVYVPRGEQIASNLVRGLLAGPGDQMGGIVRSAFGPGTGLDLSVVVDEQGVAEIPLGPEVQRLSPSDLYRGVIQLAWTLRQVPGIRRVRLSVDGAALPVLDGQTDLDIDEGSHYDPVAASGRELLALSGGRILELAARGPTAVGGPLGATGFALRSVARSISAHTIAGVAATGRRLYVAPDSGAAAQSRVDSVLDGASDLLRPAYDRFGGLWAIDAGPRGAVVHLIRGGRDQVLRVPGISGRRISSFTVTRDGTRLVAGLATTGGSGAEPTILVSGLVRDGRGRVLEALRAERIGVPGTDLGPVVDLAQDSPTTVAVLTRPPSGSMRVLSVELDGSPGDPVPVTSDPVPGDLVGLVASPDPFLQLRVVTADGRLFDRTPSGAWTRISTGVRAAAYPQ